MVSLMLVVIAIGVINSSKACEVILYNLVKIIIVNSFLDTWLKKTQTSEIPDWCEAAGYQIHDEYTGKLYVATKFMGSEKVIGKADTRGRGFCM